MPPQDSICIKFDSWTPKTYPIHVPLYIVSGHLSRDVEKHSFSNDATKGLSAFTINQVTNSTGPSSQFLEILEFPSTNQNSKHNSEQNKGIKNGKSLFHSQIRLNELKESRLNVIQRFRATGPSTVYINQLNSNMEQLASHPSLRIHRRCQDQTSGSEKIIRLFFIVPKKQSMKKYLPLLKKLAFGIELIQLFYYCTLRSTFSIENPWNKKEDFKSLHNAFIHASELYSNMNEEATLEIHVLHASKTKNEISELGNYWSIDDDNQTEKIIEYFQNMIDSYCNNFPGYNSIQFLNLVFLGFSRFSKGLSKNIGHLYACQSQTAFLSTCALNTWPTNTDDIQACFSNTAPLPKNTAVDARIKPTLSYRGGLSESIAKVIHAIAILFGMEEQLTCLDEEKFFSIDKKGSILFPSRTHDLTIQNVNLFFFPTVSSSDTNINCGHIIEYWKVGADLNFRKSLYFHSPIVCKEESTTKKQIGNSLGSVIDFKESLPAIRSRSVMSAPEYSETKAIENLDTRLISSSGSLFPQLHPQKNVNLSTDSPTRVIRLSSIEPPSIVTKITGMWKYDSGYFRQCNSKKNWKEYDKQSTKYHTKYDVVNITDSFVLLYSPVRGIYICLDSTSCRFSRDGESFQLLHLGTFQNGDTHLRVHKHKTRRSTKQSKKSMSSKWKSKETKNIFQQSKTDENIWTEYRNQHIFSTYKVEELGDEYIILKDEDSGMFVRLEESQSLWKYESSSRWELLSKGAFY